VTVLTIDEFICVVCNSWDDDLFQDICHSCLNELDNSTPHPVDSLIITTERYTMNIGDPIVTQKSGIVGTVQEVKENRTGSLRVRVLTNEGDEVWTTYWPSLV